jgi:hypothetical protein
MSPFRRTRTKHRRTGIPLMWVVIIVFLTAIVAAVLGFGGGAIHWIEKYFDYRDDSYRPMDTERYMHNTEQDRSKTSSPSKP